MYHAVESKSQEDEGRAVFEFAVMSLQNDKVRNEEMKVPEYCSNVDIFILFFNSADYFWGGIRESRRKKGEIFLS